MPVPSFLSWRRDHEPADMSMPEPALEPESDLTPRAAMDARNDHDHDEDDHEDVHQWDGTDDEYSFHGMELKMEDCMSSMGSIAAHLSPKPLQPNRFSLQREAKQKLQLIECVHIQGVAIKHNKPYYVISVHFRQERSHIPTNRVHTPLSYGSCNRMRMADATILRSYSEFDKFHGQLWEAIQQPHRHYCAFCDGFVCKLLLRFSQPGFLLKNVMRSTNMRARVLNKYLFNVLHEIDVNRPHCRYGCDGHDQVPMLLHEFLFGEGEADAA